MGLQSDASAVANRMGNAIKTATARGGGEVSSFCTLFAVLLLAGTARAAPISSTQSGAWEATATWGGVVPGSGDDVVIAAGHTVTMNGVTTRSINSLTITGTLTHAANGAFPSPGEVHKINMDIATCLTIDSAGRIDVGGLGYSAEQGPGAGLNGPRGGGGYGGQGDSWDPTTGGTTYGSITNPVNIGSGGKSDGRGGGAMILRVAGAVTNNGVITANGSNGTGSQGGGGSGGSINITAGSMAGSGTNSANGGNNTSGGGGGGGGGGRIALVVTNASATIPASLRANVTAYGGYMDNNPSGNYAPAGTIYLREAAQTYGDLIVNWANKPGSRQAVTTLVKDYSYRFDSILTTNKALLVLGTNATFDLTGCTLRSDSATNSITSRVIVGRDNGTLTWTGTWTNNGTVSWTGANLWTLPGDLAIASGGILTHESGSANSLNLNLGNLNVQSGGAIWVKGCGYPPGTGPAGYSGVNRNGGSHGGQGGRSGAGGDPGPNYPGVTYDSVTNPVLPGGGGWYNPTAGGGVVLVRATGTVTIDGVVNANGADQPGGGGTGAGGTVNIVASSLLGGGSISVNGGDNPSTDRGSGGGGRIAVALTNATTFGSVSMSVAGGAQPGNATMRGVAGTIYLKGKDQAYGKLIIPDSSYQTSTDTTLIGPYVTDAVVGDVELQSGARLVISDNTLVVYGNWSNATSSALGGNGTVDFRGATTNTLFGSTTFPNLVCTNAGKTLLFQGGTTNTVSGGTGALRLTGASGNLLNLLPATPGQQWFIKAVATPSVSFVAVSNSTAVTNGGNAITAQQSQDLGGNTNWIFSNPAPVTWISQSSTAWNVPGNWDQGRAPLADDPVIIISNGTVQAILDNPYSYNGNLIVRSGATLNLNGKNLTMGGAVTNAGTIVAAGSETLSVAKDVDFTGGSFTPASSTLKLAAPAAGAQSFTPNGQTFNRIEVVNAATVSVQNAFTTAQFYCRTNATLKFNAGSTYAVTDLLDLRGASGSLVTLRSLTDGLQWNLNVSGRQMVRYVDVKDSDAGSGKTIYAINSTGAAQNNNNWNFGDGTFWLGGTTAWGTGANWSSGSVPGPTSQVFIDETGSDPQLTGPTNIAGLTVIGITAPVTLTVDMPTNSSGWLTVNGDLYVGANATVTHTGPSGTANLRVALDVGGDLTVAGGGTISAQGKGYSPMSGLGLAPVGRAGGGHGGEGGFGHNDGSGVSRSTSYDSVTNPVWAGSGGVYGGGTAGGGVVAVRAQTVTVDGTINANGESGIQAYGAGGTVNIRAGRLLGGGSLSVNGGGNTSGGNGGGGGGGRIAVVLTNSATFGSVTMSAVGGTFSEGENGGAGTIYLKGTNQTYGLLRVSNDKSPASSATTLISPLVTDAFVGDVQLLDQTRLVISSGLALTVYGSWSNAVATNAISGGTVVFAGTGTNSVWGGNTWSNLTITTAGKVMQFQNGATQQVYGVPAFSNVTLQSTSAGSQWYLFKPGSGTQDVGVVTVQDSNAGSNNIPTRVFGADAGSALVANNNKNWILYTRDLDVLTNGAVIADGGTNSFGGPLVGTTTNVTLTITNTGTKPLTLTTIVLSGNTNEFSLGTPAVNPVPVGQSTTLAVTCTPTTAFVPISATVSISNDCTVTASKNPYEIVLTATALSPNIDVRTNGTSLAVGGTNDFGNMEWHSTTNVILTITNTGTATLTLGGIATQGLPSVFTLGAPGTNVLGVGEFTTLAVTCTPTAASNYIGHIYITNNAIYVAGKNPYDITLKVTGLEPEIGVALAGVDLTNNVSTNDYGTVNVGYSGVTKTYYVTNSGGAKLTLAGVTTGGDGSNDFTVVTNGMPSSLPPGSSTWFTVTFEPVTSGVRTASLTISNNDFDESAFVIGLTGIASNSPLGPFGATNVTEVGADLHLNLHGKAGRTYRILSSNDAAQIHTVVYTTNPPTAAFTFIDQGVVGNAAITGLYYQVAESNSTTGAWTTNPLVWALENRHNIGSNKWHLLTVPVEYGDTNQNTLAGELGRQLAGGLIPGSSETLAPNIWLQNYTGNPWTNFWLNTNRTWYAGSQPATVAIEPGRGFWLKSYLTDNPASNTVFIGLTQTNSMPVQIITNRWMLFAWPYATPGVESAWGFQGGQGGSSFDSADNIFMQYNGRSYLLWLRSNDNSWCIQNTTNKASGLSLNNRSAYFYFARGTNFWWKATKP